MVPLVISVLAARDRAFVKTSGSDVTETKADELLPLVPNDAPMSAIFSAICAPVRPLAPSERRPEVR